MFPVSFPFLRESPEVKGMATAVEEKQPELEVIAIPAAAPAPPPTTTATSSCTNPYGEFDELFGFRFS